MRVSVSSIIGDPTSHPWRGLQGWDTEFHPNGIYGISDGDRTHIVNLVNIRSTSANILLQHIQRLPLPLLIVRKLQIQKTWTPSKDSIVRTGLWSFSPLDSTYLIVCLLHSRFSRNICWSNGRMHGWVDRWVGGWVNEGSYREMGKGCGTLVPNPEKEFRWCRKFSDYTVLIVILVPPKSWK